MKNELREVIESKLKLVEAKGNDLAGFEFAFVEADWENNNKRTYPEAVVKKEINRVNDELQKSKIAGQLNHPVSSGTQLDKISHVITSVEYNEKTKTGKAKGLIINSTAGRDLKILIDTEVPFGASMRGYGTVNKRTGMVNDDYKLGTIDLVSNPSFGAKTAITKANLIESGNQIFVEQLEAAKRKNDNEDEMKKKNKRKGLTLDDIKRLRPDLLEEHKSEILIEEEALLHRRFVQAQEADYKGTFEQFKEMARNYKSEELDESSLSQRKQDELKFEREQEEKAKAEQIDRKRYDDAVTSGYNGSFEDWQKVIKEGKQKLELKEAAHSGDPFYVALHPKEGLWPHELQQAAKLERELLRKAEVKRYMEDCEKGLWVGSFAEWLEDQKKQSQRENLDFRYPR